VKSCVAAGKSRLDLLVGLERFKDFILTLGDVELVQPADHFHLWQASGSQRLAQIHAGSNDLRAILGHQQFGVIGDLLNRNGMAGCKKGCTYPPAAGGTPRPAGQRRPYDH
jgi:hypothetical protein